MANSPKILLTCPPMSGMKEEFEGIIESRGFSLVAPPIKQILEEKKLVEVIPEFAGWIAGDDPVSRKVIKAGVEGELQAIVKWGVGTDNVDFQACRDFNIFVRNTPGVFSDEVADIANGYVIGLARETFLIDKEVKAGGWPKPRGVSLRGKKIGLIGFGDIGKATAKRLRVAGVMLLIYDPLEGLEVDPIDEHRAWPHGIGECDFLVFTCALNRENFHMLNKEAIKSCKKGVRIVNVSRGPLIDENALGCGLESGQIFSAALDVFEKEPLPENSPLRNHDRVVFGSHNASNTTEGVVRTSKLALELLFEGLGV